ncbi:MAG: thiamine pyrophosphate-binding protein, partial [Pseudomonadota bacterium]|nr:thiamine pyrophosphate-binding protein [Pseudomonadota bacterium]
MSDNAFLDLLIDRLRAAGLGQIYGVPGGGGSLDLMDAARRAELEVVIAAREDAAVIMAGIAGVLAEGPGLAFATRGPGLASTLNGLAAAALDRLPALLISEYADANERAYASHQWIDQPALVKPLLRAGAELLTADPEAVDAWLGQTPRPLRRPAAMFPDASDLARRYTAPPAPAKAGSTPALGEALGPLVDRLATSRRPVFLVGLEAARPALAPTVAALVERAGGAALTTYMAAGTLAHDDPRWIGPFTGGALEQPAVRSADLIVMVGLDPVELIPRPWAYDLPVIELAEETHAPHYLTPAARCIAPLGESL